MDVSSKHLIGGVLSAFVRRDLSFTPDDFLTGISTGNIADER